MENCHTWIIISMWQNDLHTNTSRSVWPILYGLMIKMLQYKMYPAGELRCPTTALVIPRHYRVAGYYGIRLVVCPSVIILRMLFSRSLLEYTSMDFHQTWCVHWYCEDLVWDCLWANFDNFWQSYLPMTCFLFSFLDDNSSKYQWIFTKPGLCIDIVEICFWIANGQISSILTELSACNTSVF